LEDRGLRKGGEAVWGREGMVGRGWV